MPPQNRSPAEANPTTSTVHRQMEAVAISTEHNGASAMPSARPRRERVRFANRTKVYLVPTIREYSQEEFVNTWMTDDDAKAHQAGLVRDIAAMRRPGGAGGITAAAPAAAVAGAGAAAGAAQMAEHESCSRGLENMRSAAHMEQRKVHKEAVTNAVLDVQDAQFEADVYDEEEIRRASARHSRWARDGAEVLASSDAAYVRLHVRAEVDAFLREHRRRAMASRAGGSSGGDADHHLAILQNALEVSDSDDSTGSAGSKRSRLRPSASHLLNGSISPSRSSNAINAPTAPAGNKMPRTGGVDMFLNRISSRVNSANSGGANKLAAVGVSARLSVQSVMQSGTAATPSTALNENAAC